MRRALIATAGTVAALVAILEYKSSGTDKLVPVAASSKTSTPSTSSPSPGAQPSGSSSADRSGASGTAPSGSTATGSTATGSTATGSSRSSATYTGQTVNYLYGDIEVAVTVEKGKITAVNVPVNDAVDARSEVINSESVPILVREVLAAQGVNIDVVSGATYTSDAFAQSLQAALAKVPK